MGKTLFVKQDSVARLEQDLSNCRVELAETEKRINDITQSEVSLKYEVDMHKKMLVSWKIKNDLLSKEVQQLLKQLDEIKQGKKLTTDTTGDHAMKEEKDTRIQTLEKTMERQRDELKKEREENRMEKGRRIKTKAIKDSYNNVEQEKAKFINELERHKEALKRLSGEVEKVKDVGNLPEEAHSVFFELGGHVNLGDATKVVDTSAAATASVVHASTPSVISLPAVGVSGLSPKATTYSDKRPPFSRPSAEPYKTGRKLVRHRLVKSDEPQGDTEMFDAEGLGKPGPSEAAPQTGFAPSQPLACKCIATTSTTELQEESVIVGEKSSDAPMLKKSKGSESLEDNGEEPVTELAGTNMASKELESANNPHNLDGTNQEELHDDKPIDFEENQDQAAEVKMRSDDMHRDQIEPENQQSSLAVGSETEVGELSPETRKPEGALEVGEINSPELSGDDKNDEGDLTEEAGDTLDMVADVNESTTVETDKGAEPTPIASEVAPTTSSTETSSSRPVTSQSTAHGSATAKTDDVKYC
ncbi:Nuclear-pore anchor [Arachis hypogaea]|nr:Nuclear-pore anchor [Arachis hypogaea]